MIISYLRSSSIGTYEFCPWRYYLSYNLGFPEGTNRKAVLGEIVHKVMEWLALGQCVKHTNISKLTHESLLHYKEKYPHLNLNISDFETCFGWVKKILDYRNGQFDPRNRKVVAAEYFFDIEVEEPWAHYSFVLPDGTNLDGKLRLKGTIDLITEISPDVYEVIDWKTGKRLNWGTGETKDFKYLQRDKQLLLYYYVLARLFPQIDHFLMTIVFINDQGATTVPFNRSDLPRIEQMLRNEFEKIKNDINPRQNFTWKCEKFCQYSKSHEITGNASVCQFIKDKINKIGMDECNKLYTIDSSRLTSYGDGGGRTHK